MLAAARQSISFAAVKGVCILRLLLKCAKSKGRIDGRGAIPKSHKNGERRALPLESTF